MIQHQLLFDTIPWPLSLQRIISTFTTRTTRDLPHTRIKIAKDEGVNFQTHTVKATQWTQRGDGGSGLGYRLRGHGEEVPLGISGSITTL